MNIKKIVLFILITFIVTALLAEFQQKINFSFDKIIFPQMAPMLSSLIMMLLFKDLQVQINLDLKKTIIFKSLLALTLPFCLTSISFFIGSLVGLEIERTGNLIQVFPTIIIGVFVGSIGEELGWRSFLQQILERKNSALISSIIVGLIWGMWHIRYYKNGLLFMSVFLIFMISASIILAWILRATEYNTIIAILFHSSLNVGFFVFFKYIFTNSKLMFIHAIVWMIFASIIVAITGKNLIRKK